MIMKDDGTPLTNAEYQDIAARQNAERLVRGDVMTPEEKKKRWRECAQELEQITQGLSPVEKALMLAKALRDAYGNEWKIRCHDDGSFEIERTE
jgi:hypothetical protein